MHANSQASSVTFARSWEDYVWKLMNGPGNGALHLDVMEFIAFPLSSSIIYGGKRPWNSGWKNKLTLSFLTSH